MPHLPAFEQSYAEFEQYPHNLTYQPICAATAVNYSQQLKYEESRLFQPVGGDINVRFCELDSCGEDELGLSSLMALFTDAYVKL